VELSKTYRIKGVYSDEWGSSEAVAQAISKRGVKVQFMHQGFRMSEPTKELERQAILGKLNHGNNEILTWMNQNAEVKSDSNGNICLVKPSPDSPKKIDGLIGMVEALHGEMRSRKKSVYSTRTVEELLGENPNPNPT
jgi:phage terminase large subunit-like protein